jgi:hypothetical protein
MLEKSDIQIIDELYNVKGIVGISHSQKISKIQKILIDYLKDNFVNIQVDLLGESIDITFGYYLNRYISGTEYRNVTILSYLDYGNSVSESDAVISTPEYPMFTITEFVQHYELPSFKNHKNGFIIDKLIENYKKVFEYAIANARHSSSKVDEYDIKNSIMELDFSEHISQNAAERLQANQNIINVANFACEAISKQLSDEQAIIQDNKLKESERRDVRHKIRSAINSEKTENVMPNALSITDKNITEKCRTIVVDENKILTEDEILKQNIIMDAITAHDADFEAYIEALRIPIDSSELPAIPNEPVSMLYFDVILEMSKYFDGLEFKHAITNARISYENDVNNINRLKYIKQFFRLIKLINEKTMYSHDFDHESLYDLPIGSLYADGTFVKDRELISIIDSVLTLGRLVGVEYVINLYKNPNHVVGFAIAHEDTVVKPIDTIHVNDTKVGYSEFA